MALCRLFENSRVPRTISPPPAVTIGWLGSYDGIKGYCLVEFEKKEEAELAIAEMDGSQLLEQKISVTWAFVRGAFMFVVFCFQKCCVVNVWTTTCA